MSVYDVNIRIHKYDWTATAETPYEANPFSNKVPVITRADFDLNDYVLDDSFKIKWRREFIKDKFTAPRLLVMGHEISLNVSNGDGLLAEYFAAAKYGAAKVKWKADIYYKGTKCIEGWITPGGGVDYAEGDGYGHSSHVLNVRIKDKIVLAKEYFSQEQCPHPQELPWSGASIPDGKRIRFSEFLAFMFPGLPFTLSNGVPDYFVHEHPWFKVENGVLRFRRMGYERIFTNGDNKWNMLVCILNSYGMQITGYVEDGVVKALIKFRSDSFLPVERIPFRGTDKVHYTKELDNSLYEMVMIINGTMDGGDMGFEINGLYYSSLKGARLIIMSKKHEENYNCNHFDGVSTSPGPIGNEEIIHLHWDSQAYRLQKYSHEDSNGRFYITKFKRNANEPGLPPLEVEELAIDRDKIFFVHTGSSGNEAFKINLLTGSNSPHTIGSTVFSHEEMIYNGCYGEMLTRPDGQTYSEFVKTDQFKENFEPFLVENEKLMLRYEHKKSVYLNPNFVAAGEDGRSPLFGRLWDVAEMETDLYNETTTFDLIAHKFQYA